MNFRPIMMAAMCLTVALKLTSLYAQEHIVSFDFTGLESSIPAKTDFYHHVNSKWMTDHPLTAEYSSYSQFNILNDSNENRVKRIVTNLSSTNPVKGTTSYKIALIYEQGMDSIRRNREGAAPIKGRLVQIENAKPEDMTDLFIWMVRHEGSPFLGFTIMADLANSQRYALYMRSAGLGLGDRDYYLLNDKRSRDVRNAYTKLIERDMELVGYNLKAAKRIAENVIKIETLMSDSTWTREQSRNIPAMYNPRTLEQIEEMYPNLPVRGMIKDFGIAAPETVIVTEINTLKQVDNLMIRLTDREKKDFYLWNVVSAASRFLSDEFDDASFEFYKVMSGVQQQRPRWKKALSIAEEFMGEGIGQLYVEKYFPESSKIYLEDLVENLHNSLSKHIINVTWMTDDTKVAALKKLYATTVKIGYPDQWKDYSRLEIDSASSYYENVCRAKEWSLQCLLDKWGKPVDRSVWEMTPQTINAYANALNNEIVFPAGILQAPFFNPDASDAENYGGIGVVIGHELTHGFDDQGRNFDADGNMVSWWTPEDKAAFDALTKVLADQFSSVEVLPGLNANGEYTLGENIADQGGLRIAYTAWLDSQKKKGIDITSETAKINGFKPAQVFYMNFANLYANNIRDEEIRNLTIGDVHSLGINRVNVSLKNIGTFFEAFDIKPGDTMFRPEAERVIIW